MREDIYTITFISIKSLVAILRPDTVDSRYLKYFIASSFYSSSQFQLQLHKAHVFSIISNNIKSSVLYSCLSELRFVLNIGETYNDSSENTTKQLFLYNVQWEHLWCDHRNRLSESIMQPNSNCNRLRQPHFLLTLVFAWFVHACP